MIKYVTLFLIFSFVTELSGQEIPFYSGSKYTELHSDSIQGLKTDGMKIKRWDVDVSRDFEIYLKNVIRQLSEMEFDIKRIPMVTAHSSAIPEPYLKSDASLTIEFNAKGEVESAKAYVKTNYNNNTLSDLLFEKLAGQKVIEVELMSECRFCKLYYVIFYLD